MAYCSPPLWVDAHEYNEEIPRIVYSTLLVIVLVSGLVPNDSGVLR